MNRVPNMNPEGLHAYVAGMDAETLHQFLQSLSTRAIGTAVGSTCCVDGRTGGTMCVSAPFNSES